MGASLSRIAFSLILSPTSRAIVRYSLSLTYSFARRYAVVAMIVGIGIVAFRDPYGIRPLSYGKHADGSFFFCSESAALGPLNFPLVGDVAPGEAMFLDTSTGQIHSQICHASPVLSPCVFEFVYLARPDSTMDKVSVYQVRQCEHLTAT